MRSMTARAHCHSSVCLRRLHTGSRTRRRQVWDHPVTHRPTVEPLFAAAMHGVELCFLLMGEFVRDARRYVLKRPRIELLARDIIAQCALLSEVRRSDAEFA